MKLAQIAQFARVAAGVALVATLSPNVQAQITSACSNTTQYPWMNTSLSAAQRATLLLNAETLSQQERWLDAQAAANPTLTNWYSFQNFWLSPDVTYPEQVACTPTFGSTDGPYGISDFVTGVTAFPAPIALAATWDPDLARRKGQAQGDEAFNTDSNTLFAPGVNGLRDPWDGRASEMLGEDPLLSGTMAGQQMNGWQTGNPTEPVMSVLKHYIGYEQGFDVSGAGSTIIDARTLHEIYELPFAIAIATGHPGGVMCSYNQLAEVDGTVNPSDIYPATYGCQNSNTLGGDLLSTGGMNFPGFVVSDLMAEQSTVASLNAGMHQELGYPHYYSPANLAAALQANTITQQQIYNAAFRVVQAYIANGLFDHPLPPWWAVYSDWYPANHTMVALKMAQEGTVLLQNNNNTLPLTKPGQTIAIIGPTQSAIEQDGTYNGNYYFISARTVCTSTFPFPYLSAPNFPPVPAVECPAWRLVDPLTAITSRAAELGDTIISYKGLDGPTAASTAKGANVAIVFGYYAEGEGEDLYTFDPTLSLYNNGDAEIEAVAATGVPTIVILETGNAVLTPWRNSVAAILEAWYPGVQQGNALSTLLFGDANPSGKLPVSFPNQIADLPTGTPPNAQYPGVSIDGVNTMYFTEGMDVGYRWYDHQNITPAFPFGFGLSYTTFSYSNLQVTPTANSSDVVTSANVTFNVTNTGRRSGTEIAQVYLALPAGLGEPPKRLVGWSRVTLNAGQTQPVTVTIDASSPAQPLSYWNMNSRSWVTPSGTFTVYAGPSSRTLPLSARFVNPL